jgi:hypothetical protein
MPSLHQFQVFADFIAQQCFVVAEFNQHPIHVQIQDLDGPDVSDEEPKIPPGAREDA